MRTSRLRGTIIAVPAGVLGIGVRQAELDMLQHGHVDAIALDAGSTDSGPAYLATARSKMAREAVLRDLEMLLRTRERVDVPLLIGSCGTCGADAAVDWTYGLLREVCAGLGINPRVALLYSSQDGAALKDKLKRGKLRPLAPTGEATEALIDACDNIVALMGPEPYIRAIADGADVVLGGRTTDTAVLAAVALMRGAGAGPAWHAAKTAECGALCTTDQMQGGVLISIDAQGFDVVPLGTANRCTPYTVSAHMLYENSDPFRMTEPGGELDVADARYVSLDARTVRVEGSLFRAAETYTMKLEGAGGGPFQTLMLVGIRDPRVLGALDGWLQRLEAALHERVADTMGEAANDYSISLRPYGWNAVSGAAPEPDAVPPSEVGLLFVASAPTQALATQIAKVCNPYFFHYPFEDGAEIPSYAFPFSPAEIERGQAYAFHLNHVVETDNPFELVRTRWGDASGFTDDKD